MDVRARWSHFVWVAALLAGCAGALTPVEKQPHFGQYFTMSMLGDTEQAKLEGPRLYGAGLEVSRFDDGYRGTGRSGVIDLHTAGMKISGMVGTGSTELFVEDGQGALHVRGRFGERMSELEVKPDRVAGTIGRCHYDLQRPGGQGPWYEGQRACSGAIAGVRLALPQALAAMPPIDRAALLSIFLASEEIGKGRAAIGTPQGDPRVPHRQPGVMGGQAPTRDRGP